MEVKQQSEFQELDQQLFSQLSSSDVNLIPYSQVNGKWTVPDMFMKHIFDQVVLDGNFETVFFDGLTRDSDAFLTIVQQPGNIVLVVLNGADELLGIAWMNGFSGNHAFGHFCFMNTAREKKMTEKIGKRILSYWFSFPNIDVILGVVPSFNTFALNYIERLGFERVGEIKGIIQSPFRTGRYGSVISYLSNIKEE